LFLGGVLFMIQVNMHEAKTNLSSLVAKGESFIIAKSGKPVVTVIPYSFTQRKKQRVGFMKGLIKIPDDFNRIGEEEVAAMFEVME
jgi:antitoxin (DNA-binding transcriptional repressor) of toxin-antitoxin stability system